MRILHTSDWHIGRSFHGHSTLDALRSVLDGLVREVRERAVDLVIVAGDVFDSAMPAADCYRLLTDVLTGIREAGARVVVTSGNHDSPARLGFQAPLLREGIHVATDPSAVGTPITLDDDHGPVHIYPIPYLEPALVRHLWPEETLRTHEQVVRHAMRLINDDRASRGGRSVAIAHIFAAGVEATPQLEREVRQSLTQGTLDVVPVADLEGPDYIALGHIHGRAQLSDRVRYAGAPLHYSFGEADKPRGAWLVELDAEGLAATEWIDFAIPRPLVTLDGTIEQLLSAPEYDAHLDSWVCAVLTDRTAPLEPMQRLRQRFPFCATIERRPKGEADERAASYRDRVGRGTPDPEIVDGFLRHVRRGEAATEDEARIIADVVAAHGAEVAQ